MNVYTLFLFVGIAALIITAIRMIAKKSGNITLAYLQSFLGSLFIFSGVVKAIDPLGTSYKMKEYFEAFAQDGMAQVWEAMAHYSTEMAVMMIVFEIAAGVALIIGWKEKIAVSAVFCMNLFFLFLTGYTYLSGYGITKKFMLVSFVIIFFAAISVLFNDYKRRRTALLIVAGLIALVAILCQFTDICFTCEFTKTKMKVTDCGCFGDFMKLKPWETFYKDVILTLMTVYLVYYRNKIQPLFGSNIRWALTIAAFVGSLLFCLKNFVWGLPIVDFRPYAIGNNINEQMITPKRDSMVMVFVYKNKTSGEIKEFGMTNIPTDTNWSYVDRKDVIIEEGIPAKISNLMIEGDEGANITTAMINDTATTYWIVAWNLKETKKRAWKEKIKPFVARAKKEGKKIYVLTNMHDQGFEKEMGLNIPYYLADATPLKTMIRSNPGLMEIKNGTVMNMWHWTGIPEYGN